MAEQGLRDQYTSQVWRRLNSNHSRCISTHEILVYVCMYACMWVYMCVCMYVCMHACMHVCMSYLKECTKTPRIQSSHMPCTYIPEICSGFRVLIRKTAPAWLRSPGASPGDRSLALWHASVTSKSYISCNHIDLQPELRPKARRAVRVRKA